MEVWMMYSAMSLDAMSQIQKGGGGPDEHLVFKSYKNRDYCWDVPGRRFEEGTNLQIWKCNGTPAQQFVIVPFGKDNQG